MLFSELFESSKAFFLFFAFTLARFFNPGGLDGWEKSLFFRPLLLGPFPAFCYRQLIFCQKKILVKAVWFCQNKTTKFELLTLLNN